LCTQKAPDKEVIGIMPTYEYLCQACSHRFETWQKMTDDPLTNCPECESPIRRVLYPAGVVFKGSGFYKTDHGSTSAVASESSSDGKKAESADGSTKTSQGESKSSSESSTASSSNSSNNTSSSASKSTAPAGTK
jgi:putative FmdB family regulatory protein